MSSFVSTATTPVQAQKEELSEPAPDEKVPVRFLAKFKPQFVTDAASHTMALDYLATLGLRLEREYQLVPGLVRLERANTTDAAPLTIEGQIKALQESGMFEYVEPDRPVRTMIQPGSDTSTEGER